ncbi:MAG: hypothetical protein QM773_14785 [Hyphomonadaceae bacterium]
MIRAILLALALAPAALAQTPDIPRTADGHPDFGGVWESFWLTPLERPDGVQSVDLAPTDIERVKAIFRDRETNRLAGNLGTEGETAIATEIMQVAGVYRSSQVIDPPDGRIPRTAIALARKTSGSPDGPEGFTRGVRCLAGVSLPPMGMANFDNMRRIVQTPDSIVIYAEVGPDLRIISFGAPKTTPEPRTMGGRSFARWEGDMLVIETTNFDGKAPPGGGARANPLSDDALVVEQFRYVSKDEVVYRYTVTDPLNYSQPWSGELSWRRSSQHLYETVCHEGNYSLANMLSAARVAETRAAQK